MDNFVLQMSGISKSFYGVKVLDNVNFMLERGHVHAIVGGNGAGKSTLMKILTGVYTKDAGEVLIDGQSENFSGYANATKAGVRMIFQELSIISSLSVTENIYLNHEIKKGIFNDDRLMKENAEKLLARLGIDVPVDAKVKDLSVGYCQLIEISKALSEKVKILVMDEPTASLSDSEVTRLFEIVKTLKAEGVSIVYISHRMNEILAITDEVSVLRDGKNVITEKSVKLSVPAIVNYMLGDVERRSFEYHAKKPFANAKVLLEINGLSVDKLVNEVSFQVQEGEIVGLAGLMGSGRTEILEALFGMRKIQAGVVKIMGQDVIIKNPYDAINAGIALVPEDRRREGLVLSHTVKDNVLLALFKRVMGLGPFIDVQKINAIVNDSIMKLNVKTKSGDATINTLSGGNQQKIVIAKWLKNEPRLLLLDEPTAGIDIGAKGEIISIIDEYAAAGNGVIVVSSEISELVAMCDKIIVLVDGKKHGELTRENRINEEVIQNAIQG
jgi:ribose transport system ATP-binding protein